MKLAHFLPSGLLRINLFAEMVALSLSAESRNCKEKGVESTESVCCSELHLEQPLKKSLDTLLADRKSQLWKTLDGKLIKLYEC